MTEEVVPIRPRYLSQSSVWRYSRRPACSLNVVSSFFLKKDVFEKEPEKNHHTIPPPVATVDGQLDEFNLDDEEKQTKDASRWPQPQPKPKENRIESVDSVEEMQRRFEKVC